jgi:hypothetical protein
MLCCYFKIGLDRFLEHPFEFVFHKSTLHDQGHWKCVARLKKNQAVVVFLCTRISFVGRWIRRDPHPSHWPQFVYPYWNAFWAVLRVTNSL